MTTIGDAANFADCMQHLEIQTLCCSIDIIDHVGPLSAAFEQMIERCRTPFYVQVDEDMILFPDAIENLERLMGDSAPDVAMVCAPLWDCDTERAIEGVKIYRHEIVKQFPYENTLSCETRQHDRIIDAGFRTLRLPMGDRCQCFGEHGKHYTPLTIFKRWQRVFQKLHQLGKPKWIEPWPEKLLQRYLQSREQVHLYALLGALAGITGAPAPDREKDWREPNEALDRIRHYFPLAPELGRDPSGL